MSNTLALLDAMAQKADRIRRCVARAREEYSGSTDFARDFSRQDAAILNIQRACEQAIDMANMLISEDRLGLPRSAREVFALLQAHAIIPAGLSASLQGMVGFRNIAVHQYENLDIAVVESVIVHRLDDVLAFAGHMLSHLQQAQTPASKP